MGVRIVWGPPKRRFDAMSHGLDLGVATLEFLADAVIRPARKGRPQAVGITGGRAVSLILPPGSEAISPLIRDPFDPFGMRIPASLKRRAGL